MLLVVLQYVPHSIGITTVISVQMFTVYSVFLEDHTVVCMHTHKFLPQ